MSTSTLQPTQDYDFNGQCMKARSITAGMMKSSSSGPKTSIESTTSISLSEDFAEESRSQEPEQPSSSFPALLLEEEDSYVAVRGGSSDDDDLDDDGVMSLQTAMTERSTDEGMNNDEDEGRTNDLNTDKHEYDATMMLEEGDNVNDPPIKFEIDDDNGHHETAAPQEEGGDVGASEPPSSIVSMIVDETSSGLFSEPASRAKPIRAPAHDDHFVSCIRRHNVSTIQDSSIADRGSFMTHNLFKNSSIQSKASNKFLLANDFNRDTRLLVSSTDNLTPASPTKIEDPLPKPNSSLATTDENASSMDYATSPIRSNDVASQQSDDDIYGSALFSDAMDNSSTSEEPEPVLNSSSTAIVPYTPSTSLVPFEKDEVSTTEEPANEKYSVVPSPLFSSTFETTPSSSQLNSNHNRGLVNLGNTCYMNSALQMLFSQHQFIADLYQYDIDSEQEKSDLAKEEEEILLKTGQAREDDKSEDKKSLRKAFLSLAREMKLIPQIFDDSNPASLPEHSDHEGGYRFRSFSSSSAVNPSTFKAVLDSQCCLFEGYQQQDAHEYLSTVLDMLHDEIVDEQKKLRVQKRKLEAAAESSEIETCVSDDDKEADVETSADEGTGNTAEHRGSVVLDESGQKRGHEELDDSITEGEEVDEPEVSNTSIADAPTGLTRRASSFAELSTAGISQLLHDGASEDEDSVTAKIPRTSDVPLPPPLLLGGRLASTPTDVSSGSRERKAHPVWGYCNPPSALLGVVEETDAAEDIPNDMNIFEDADPAEAAGDGPDDVTPSERSEGDDISLSAPSPSRDSPPEEDESKATEENKEEEKESEEDNEEEEMEDICTPIETHFGAKVEVRLTCNSCKYTRTKTESYRYFSLDLTSKDEDDSDDYATSSFLSSMKSKNSSVEDGLKRFFEPEVIDLKCEKCFSSQATETKEIVRLPRVLLLHFKRFIVEWDRILSRVRYEKNRSLVEFKREVDLRDYYGPSTSDDEEKPDNDETSDSNSDEDERMVVPSYKLKSIVHHHGYTASCGHYTADGLRSLPDASTLSSVENEDDCHNISNDVQQKQWMHFNDSYVSNVQDENSLLETSAQASAYMVMYECNA